MIWMMILSAGLAGLAVALAVRAPSERLAAVGGDHDRRDRFPRLRRLLVGRRGAPPLRLRAAAGAGLGLAVIMVGQGQVAELGALLLVPAVAVGFGVVVLTGWVETGAGRRRRHQLIMELPQALSLLGAAVGAGLPLRTATRHVAAGQSGPVADDLGRVLAEIELGRPEGEAWRDLRQDPVWAPIAVDLARSVESGTRLAEGLSRHAELARRRRQASIEVVARGVGVRSVLPLMACFVPAFILIGIVPTIASALLKVFG
ncbi:type II secretion system F family protein [Microlunatus speluncae]|uniref:type II secretion system F family protein n=1 Tax=Microlunatus speluncae TaxID=2594267 RepID=UPI0012664660|nr:type II secretion system F family protein [Microlunatus speluncae]